MYKAVFLIAAAMLTAAGCRSRELRDVPEVTPLPRENVRISMDVNISDTAAVPAENNTAAESRTAAAAPESDRVKKAQRKAASQVILSDNEKSRQKKSARRERKRKEYVPDVTGLIDGELNSVERRYVQDVRRRREEQVQKSEQQVFGSFKPEGIFKSNAE